MLKNFFVFFCFALASKVDISLDKKITNIFKSQLIKKRIYEPNIYAIEFEKQIILIGILSNYKNLYKIMHLTKNHKKKVLNFLTFKKNYYNKKHIKNIKIIFKKEKINFNDFFFHEQENIVWIIGYSNNFYEKEKAVKILKKLKEKGIINDFFCCLRFKKNNNKGFIFRHKT